MDSCCIPLQRNECSCFPHQPQITYSWSERYIHCPTVDWCRKHENVHVNQWEREMKNCHPFTCLCMSRILESRTEIQKSEDFEGQKCCAGPRSLNSKRWQKRVGKKIKNIWPWVLLEGEQTQYNQNDDFVLDFLGRWAEWITQDHLPVTMEMVECWLAIGLAKGLLGTAS